MWDLRGTSCLFRSTKARLRVLSSFAEMERWCPWNPRLHDRGKISLISKSFHWLVPRRPLVSAKSPGCTIRCLTSTLLPQPILPLPFLLTSIDKNLKAQMVEQGPSHFSRSCWRNCSKSTSSNRISLHSESSCH